MPRGRKKNKEQQKGKQFCSGEEIILNSQDTEGPSTSEKEEKRKIQPPSTVPFPEEKDNTDIMSTSKDTESDPKLHPTGRVPDGVTESDPKLHPEKRIPEGATEPVRRIPSGEDNDDDPLIIDEDKPNEGNDEDDPNDSNPLIIDEEKQNQSKDKSTAETEEVAEQDEGEKDFEPTVDMMMNEFDDERTMEEEEALDQEDEAEELNALTQEQDMPLEELLKMYGYNQAADKDADTKEEPEEEEIDEELSEEKLAEDDDEIIEPTLNQSQVDETSENLEIKEEEGGSMSPPPAKKLKKSELARFYEAAIEGKDLDDESGEENGDETDEGKDYSWKKTIMIGPSYQAVVPPGLTKYDDTPPYENEDKKLWDPNKLDGNDTEEYLRETDEIFDEGDYDEHQGVGGIPNGSHLRDDEQALYLLLQCGHNTKEALRRTSLNCVQSSEPMSLWSEEECRAFETGLRVYGKDFYSIKAQKVGSRSVGELVQFYYLWKKTERHDMFVDSFWKEKKKYALHPGTTDYMDRLGHSARSVDDQNEGKEKDPDTSPSSFVKLPHALIYKSTSRRATETEGTNGGNEDVVIPEPEEFLPWEEKPHREYLKVGNRKEKP